MKYIRTKDAIYKVRKPALDEYLWEDSTYVYKHEHIKNSEIIKQADTIDDLCDEFVVVREKQKPITFTNLEQVQLNRGTYGFSNSIVYGAIWTDKGLIYVAKMNESGCLELL